MVKRLLNNDKNMNERQGIHSSQKLNSDLAKIRYKVRKSNRVILEEICSPLAKMLEDKVEGNYYIVVEKNCIKINVYGLNDFLTVQSGKLTSTMQDTIYSGTD